MLSHSLRENTNILSLTVEYLINNISKSPYITNYKFEISKLEIDDEKINDFLDSSKKNLQLIETKGGIKIKV